MERRKEKRLRVTQPVMLLALGERGNRLIEACVLDISRNGVRVRSSTSLACETQVKIDGEDVHILGTVSRCEAQKGGSYNIAIKVSDPLSSLIELELLNRALIQPEGSAPKLEPAQPPGDKRKS
jgi:hypothetical protein